MLIQVIGQKYQCGSNIGLYYHDQEGYLKDLNSLIEWDKCIFPKDLKEGGSPFNPEDYIENREYLGKEPQLKPGDVFYWDSNIFAIDSEDRSIVLESESGFLAVERFVTEVMKDELILTRPPESIKKVDVAQLKELPADYQKVYIPKYNLLKTWKEKYLLGRIDEKEWPVIVLRGDSDNFLISPTLFIKGWKVYYSRQEVDEDMIEDCTNEYLSWLYTNNERLVILEKKKCIKEKEEEN